MTEPEKLLKRTSLYDIHKALGATTVPFAGWDMPVSYRGTVGEVAAVRDHVGLFDVSHMGEARVTGPGAFDFVQRLTTNNVSKLIPGKAQYSLLLNPTGGIIDDIIVYRMADEDFMIRALSFLRISTRQATA
jgi:aminomethyltransferase